MAREIDTGEFERHLEREIAESARKRLFPQFNLGDTVRVNVKVRKGNRTSVQAYEGVCIARSGTGLSESFTIRKISYGEGLERVFPVHSPLVDSVEVISRGKVRRAKLYYLRDRRGKSALIVENAGTRGRKLTDAEEKKVAAAQSLAIEKAAAEAAEKIATETLIKDMAQAALSKFLVEQNATLMRDVDPTVMALVSHISQLVHSTRVNISTARIEEMVKLLLPSEDLTAPVRADIDVDNAELRTKFISLVATYSASELAKQAGHEARNRSATANRWKKSRQIFSVVVGGRELFPTFQFANGRPKPVIAEVLSTLPSGMSNWQIAFWFVSSNSWLDGRAPVELLEDRATLLNAAQFEHQGIDE